MAGFNSMSQEIINRDVIRALERMAPMEPRYIKGLYGSRYDSYSCAQCGCSISEITWHYCPNCGQRLTDAYAGRRKTKREQNKYHQANIFDYFAEMQKEDGE